MNQFDNPAPTGNQQSDRLPFETVYDSASPSFDGHIVVIPLQSTQSCEKVIVALANQLEWAYYALSMAMETHIYDKHADRADFYDDVFSDAYFSSQKCSRTLPGTGRIWNCLIASVMRPLDTLTNRDKPLS